jgi:TetR/AcrR family transcriptional regulator, cholesterol catabolism regulator
MPTAPTPAPGPARRGPRRAGAPARRDEILGIAAAIFARQGVARTTVRDIAREAGILSGSLYHHFESKDEILDEIVRQALEPDIERDEALALSPDLEPVAAVHELILRSLTFQQEHPDVAQILAHGWFELRGTPTYELVERRSTAIRRAWTSVLRRGREMGVFRADLDVELAYRAMIATVGSASQWYRPSGPRTMEEIAAELARMFLVGFVART